MARADEITVQIAECGSCGSQAVAIYEESRGGALSGESLAHRGYPLTQEKFQLLGDLFNQCPDRFKRACACPAHRELARQVSGADKSGFFQKEPFLMKPA